MGLEVGERAEMWISARRENTDVWASFARNFSIQMTRLTPLGVAVRNHYVETVRAALVRGLYQSKVAQVLQVVDYELVLRLVKPALGQVHGDSGQMRRSVVAGFGSGVAIVPAQLVLLLHGADRGVDLERTMEFVVKGLAQVGQELVRPRTYVTLVGLDDRTDAERFGFLNLDELLGAFQLFQLLVVGNAWQLQAVNLFVLPQH